MSSAASAAGYISSAGLVSSIPALYLATGRVLTWWEMMLWLGAVAPLGVFMAVPLKRQLINIDQLPFPSGIATAETLKGIHSAGGEAMQKAKALLVGGGGRRLGEALERACRRWPHGWAAAPIARPGASGSASSPSRNVPAVSRRPKLARTIHHRLRGLDIMVAAGAIMGIRVGVSLLIGAVVYYGIIGSVLIETGDRCPAAATRRSCSGRSGPRPP